MAECECILIGSNAVCSRYMTGNILIRILRSPAILPTRMATRKCGPAIMSSQYLIQVTSALSCVRTLPLDSLPTVPDVLGKHLI
jgi:hypothetical protein